MSDRERLPFRKLCELGDRILEKHHRRCQEAGTDSRTVAEFHATVDTFEVEMHFDILDVEINALYEYVGASLRLRLDHRQHLVAYVDGKDGVRYTLPPWPDEKYPAMPPLEKQERMTRDYERSLVLMR